MLQAVWRPGSPPSSFFLLPSLFPLSSFLRSEAPSSGFYANGVKLQSPASRSARWVADQHMTEPQRGSTKDARGARQLGMRRVAELLRFLGIVIVILILIEIASREARKDRKEEEM